VQRRECPCRNCGGSRKMLHRARKCEGEGWKHQAKWFVAQYGEASQSSHKTGEREGEAQVA
jgi:hypothetical protein